MKTIALVSTLLLGFAAASVSMPASAAPINIGDLALSATATSQSNPLLHQVQSRGEDNRDNLASDGFRNNFRNPQTLNRGNNFSRFRDQRFQNRGFNQNRFQNRGFIQNRFQRQGFSGQRFRGQGFRGQSFRGQGFRGRGFGGQGLGSKGFKSGGGFIAKKKLGLAKKFLLWRY